MSSQAKIETRAVSAMSRATAPQAAHELVETLRSGLEGRAPKLVFVFASTRQPLAELVPIVAAAFPGSMLLGSSTAGEFTEKSEGTGAAVAVAISGDFQVFAGIGRNLANDTEGAAQRAIADIPSEQPGYPHRTGILLVDSLAGKGEEASLLLAILLGDQARLAGGAAADDMKMVATHVACGTEVASDALVYAAIFSKEPLGIGVCHGHRPLSKPLRVTRSSGAVVYELDGRPAFEVWKDETRARARVVGIDVDDLREGAVFSDYLNRYEAGLETGGAEFKVRVPMSRTEDGALRFGCGMPEGSMLRVMESIADEQIASAREATRRALVGLGGTKPAVAIVFDCSCRKAILRDEFGQAVRAIADELGPVPLAGFETYGEIALDVGDMSGFHNTTTVVVAFP